MKSEMALRIEAVNILIKKLGEVDAERFIASIKDENFNYTNWQRNLWAGQSIDEIHNAAVKYAKRKSKK
jgi:hypothetical protein